MAAIYCLIQMLVLVGTIVTMAEKGLCHPTTVFFLFVTGTFILGGLLHPQEIFNVVHGFVYFLAIPTMYMILMIYAFCNLHVISWGTREIKKTASEVKADQRQRELEELTRMEEQQTKEKGLFGGFTDKFKVKRKRDCRCGNFLNIACCSQQDATEPEVMQVLLTNVANIDRTLTQLLEVIGKEAEVKDAERPPSTLTLTQSPAVSGGKKQQLVEAGSPQLQRHGTEDGKEDGEKKKDGDEERTEKEEADKEEEEDEDKKRNKKDEEDHSNESVDDAGIQRSRFHLLNSTCLNKHLLTSPICPC